MSESFEPHIKSIQHTLNVMIQNYEVWWKLKSKETRDQYLDTMNQHPTYFLTAIHAHFVAYVVAGYSLFEKRHDTFSIYALSRILKQDSAKLELRTQIANLVTSTKDTHRKVSMLRNNVFGHKSIRVSDEQAFARAGLTPNEMRRYIDQCITSSEVLGHRHAFNLNAGGDIAHLLRNLRLRSSG